MSNLLQKASRALAASAENGGVENGHALSGASILEGQFQGLRSSAELTFISEPGNMLLRGSFDSMVTPLLHGPTRRGELQVAKIALRLMSFGKLSRMVDLVTQRIDEQAKPGAKGKRKPSTEITELAGELKGAKESLKDRLPEVIEMLDGLVKRDTEIEWTALAADLFEVRFPHCLYSRRAD